MTPCPTTDELRRLLDAPPEDPEAAAFAAHLEICPACQRALDTLTRTGPVLGNRPDAPALATEFAGAAFLRDLEGAPPRTPWGETAPSGNDSGAPSDPPNVPGYELLDVLGRGGMGVVYRARQASLGRVVALKMIPSAVDSAAVLARFEVERQALALMDHPNIAKVLDAGVSPDGRPYFVMELVEGMPVTEYCDARRLPTRHRLALLIPICRAVQHAHQKGVIHRDLKPSNILVAEVDGRPVPKVIDFGVAKAIAGRLTDRTLFTQHGAVVGTLEYMSPEQAELGGMDVDTRSDIYSLGVVLYELLTGSTPLGRDRVRRAGIAEILRRIKEEDPPKPSTRLSASGEMLAEVAARRGTDPGRLTRAVRGDIDWVALKALEKDRTRRYESAEGLAEDIRRFLDGEPVLAQSVGTAGRAWRWCRRRPAVAALLLVVGLLLVGIAGGSAAAAVRFRRLADDQKAARALADRRASEAKAVLDFLINEMLAAADPEIAGPKLTVDEVLIRADRLIEGRFSDQPLVEATIRHSIGDVFWRLGLGNRAEPQARRARDLRIRYLGRDHHETLLSTIVLARSLHNLGRLDEATRLAEEAAEIGRRTLGPDHFDTLEAECWVGQCLCGLPNDAQLPRARKIFERIGAVVRPGLPDRLSFYCGTMGGLAWTLFRQGKLDESMAVYDEIIPLLLRHKGPDSTEAARYLDNKGAVLWNFGRTEEAAAAFEESAKISLRVEDPRFVRAYWVLDRLINLRFQQAAGPDRAAARDAYGKALAVIDRGLARGGLWRRADPANVAAYNVEHQYRTSRSVALKGLGRRDEAVEEVGRDLDSLESSPLSADARRLARLSDAVQLARLGATDRAVALARREAEGKPPPSAAANYDIACVYAVAADALRDDPAQAARYVDRALASLGRAIDGGFRDPKHMAVDPDLAYLQPRPEFRALLDRISPGPSTQRRPGS
jgi:non-specific serine/threonine protein kinase/serine/threonine-protein kinase